MHKYRTHNCNELNSVNVGQLVKLSGWVHKKRDHGSLVFVDLRDNFGITQLIFSKSNYNLIDEIIKVRLESVITVIGKVSLRSSTNINKSIFSGEIEVLVEHFSIQSEADALPLEVNSRDDILDDVRFKYRFLDLRRKKLHDNILLRSKIISEIRNLMMQSGFTEFQTPILTASSPEGARDFLVPSRLHPGKFYALPQSPQQFKQLIMASGFDRYFQIAPCFRDEDSRSDRSPGEFYQLDIEMSFVTQEDVFVTIEPIIRALFSKFSNKSISNLPFPKIPYKEAILKYGSDKPDLRNPIVISDVTDIFAQSQFLLFKNNVNKGELVRAIPAYNAANRPRSFLQKITDFVKLEGFHNITYIIFDYDGGIKGPLVKFLQEKQILEIRGNVKANNGDIVFFLCGTESEINKLAGNIRAKIASYLELINKNCFSFCWVVDFPFYELDSSTGKICFSHNPFSMPQGGLDVLIKARTLKDLLDIKAYQYDIVCNGIELSSGAIRNHKLDIIYKAFEIAGYNKEEVDRRFGGLIKAFRFGTPPHGGIAPGIDRIVMLIAEAENIRDVIAFPFTQRAEDLLMGAPNTVSNSVLSELNIALLTSIKNDI